MVAPVTETPAKASWLAVLLSYAGRCRGKMAVSLLCSVASVAAGLVPFYAVYRIIDEVIAPSETRVRIISSLRALHDKRAATPAKKHGNIPL